MLPIIEVAKKLNLREEVLFLYGTEKAKVVCDISDDKKSKLILVTAINPTPYGEGKTTVTIGLNDAFRKIGKNSLAVLREPSLGPVFGLKGGATGGGLAKVEPSLDINLHFNGDFHAITAANNLLCAAVDNHIYQGNNLNIDENHILVKRCLDVNDRSLRDKFQITAASEVMAIFCLAKDREDLKRRLSNILVAYDLAGNPIYAKDLRVSNAMYLLLKDAFYPNLVQSLEENPVLIHGGPFANIAHGCNSVVATKTALSLADYVVTEAGFGSDLGAEKFLNIKCRKADLAPNYICLVVTVRALKHSGIDNLEAHIRHLKSYKVPFCVVVNKFFDDKDEDLEKIAEYCKNFNVDVVSTNSYALGGNGSIELANYLVEHLEEDSKFENLYSSELSIEDKIFKIASSVYNADDVIYSEEALNKLTEIKKLGLENYPVCMAKTPYSISDDPKKLGYPSHYSITVRDIVIQTGSEMIIVLLNKIITMPGLPEHPRFEEMN
ncbi:MAG: formate--tetrahydrofolate ligase [Firmicutes bacterium]|nr:formate--tetrahydrofolate ligase [Bacillota bacterium]